MKRKVDNISIIFGLLVMVALAVTTENSISDKYKDAVIILYITLILFITVCIVRTIFQAGKKQYLQTVKDNQEYHNLEDKIKNCNTFLEQFQKYVNYVMYEGSLNEINLVQLKDKKDELLTILSHIPKVNNLLEDLNEQDEEEISEYDVITCHNIAELVGVIYYKLYELRYIRGKEFREINSEIYPYIKKYYDTIIVETNSRIKQYRENRAVCAKQPISFAARIYGFFVKVEKTQDAIIMNEKHTKEIKEGLEKVIHQKTEEIEQQQRIAAERKYQLDNITKFLHDLFASSEDNVVVSKQIIQMLDNNEKIDWKSFSADKTGDVIVSGICGAIKLGLTASGIPII